MITVSDGSRSNPDTSLDIAAVRFPSGSGHRGYSVFNIAIETCVACDGALPIIACIEDAALIEPILAHLAQKEPSAPASPLPPSRAPPQAGWFH